MFWDGLWLLHVSLFLEEHEHCAVRKLSDEHSFQGSLQVPRSTQLDHPLFVELLRDVMIVTQKTTVKDV